MKRLLCIVGSMNTGGAETFLMKMYREVDKSQCQFDFAVASKEKGFYDDEIISMGGRIFHITPKSVNPIKNFYSILTLVKREQYKSVLRSSQHSLSALELLAAWLGGAKKRIYRSSNSNITGTSKLELFLHKVFVIMPILFANVRIAPSVEAAEFMFGKNCIKKGKAQLVHNSLDTTLYSFDLESRNQLRKEFNISEKEILIGHIGRFNHQKNHIFLIEIFKKYLKLNPRAKLVLVGDGELRSSIIEKVAECEISDSVIFTGVRKDVPQLLSAFDLFLFPSFYEGMPNTVIEAQSTGLHCIISDSITKDVNVTDLVSFVSLNNDSSVWANKIAEVQNGNKQNRKQFHTIMKQKGYDISDCLEKFIKINFY